MNDFFDQPLSSAGQTRECRRCGKPCVVAPTARVGSRPIRHAERGYCLECAVTRFLKDDLDINRLLDRRSSAVAGAPRTPYIASHDEIATALRLPHIQAQFRRAFEVGHTEADALAPDWERIIEEWDRY